MNSKRKGSRIELEVVAALAAMGLSARRTQQYQGWGSDGDVVIDGADVHTEVKGRSSIAIYDWLDQAKRDSRGRRPYWVVCKADRRELLAVVPLASLFEVVRRLHDAMGEAEATASPGQVDINPKRGRRREEV